MRIGLWAAATVMTLAGLWSSASSAPPANWPASLTIGTASPGGVFLPYGTAMAQILSKALGIPVEAQATQGSAQNILLLENGTVQLGLVSTDVALDGWNGSGAWTHGKKLRSMRALFPMYDSPIVAVARTSSGIRSLPDVAGKRVAAGPPSNKGIVVKAFDVLGIQAAWRYGAYDTLSTEMQSGQVDALVSTIASPAPVLTGLDRPGEIRFVPMSADEIAKLCAAMPQFSPSVVPAGTYRSLRAPYTTVGWFSFVVASKDLPDDLVYAIVKAFYANHDRMVQAHPSARESVVANLKRNTFIPYHPGAVRYYREIGAEIPAALAAAR
jgi:TRAP transporter TAXI family solute receptor